jgi:hypothetical protein
MIYHDPQYSWRFERYQDILEQQEEKQAQKPEASQHAMNTVKAALEPQT